MVEADKKKSDDGKALGGLRFTINYGGKLEKTVTLAQDCIFLGRLLTCHLPVEDPKVSRMHSVIEVREGREVILTDLDSSNGTRVNGKEHKIVNLADGDTVEIGDSSIKVEFLSAEKVAEMPAVVYHSGISRGLGQQVGIDTVMLDAKVIPSDVEVSSMEIDTILRNLEPAVVRSSKPGSAAGKASGKSIASLGKIGVKKPTPKQVTARKSLAEADTLSDKNAMVVRPQMDKAAQERALRLIRGTGTALEVKVQWGEEILDVLHLDKPITISVGTGKQNTYIIPPMEAYPASIPMIAPMQERTVGGFTLGFTDRMEGWVYTGEKLHSLEELKKSPKSRATKSAGEKLYFYPLSPSDKGMLSIENLAFCFQTVRSFPIYQSPPNKVDRRPFFILLSLYVAFVAFSLFFPMPPPDVTVAESVAETKKALDMIYDPKRARSIIDSLVNQKLRQAEVGSVRGDVRGKALTAGAQRGNYTDKKVGGEEGARSKGAPQQVPSTTPAQIAGQQQVAKAMSALRSDNIARLLSNSGFTGSGGGGVGATNKQTGINSTARLFANLGGSLKGAGASGGPGGSGGGDSVDVGGLGTKGRGSGQGGYGTVKLGDKLEASVDGGGEEGLDVRGALDKDLIRKVIRRNYGQIEFCYDTKLQLARQRGGASGRVMIRWRILPSGRVVDEGVKSTTINDRSFEDCLTDRIRTWVFPEPKGGGSVTVEYPFVFRPSGGS